MRVLIIGGGGREHAIAWKLKQSPDIETLYCAPGNAGISTIANCVSIDNADINGIADFAEHNSIDLTVVGPELPLILGIADEFMNRGLPLFGPSRAAAELEGSKIFTKHFLQRHKIPTARYRSVNSMKDVITVLESGEIGMPLVIKADGLAGGKGVLIVNTVEDALRECTKLITDHRLGEAGSKLVLEEFLNGEEVSIFALSDGANAIPLVAAQDFKRAFDDDRGPNTGGMGCICPATNLNQESFDSIFDNIVQPTINGLAAEDRNYKGILYCGLMLTNTGPKVLEFNVRLGDPETQAILPRLESDLLPLLMSVVSGELRQQNPLWTEETAVSIVLASNGYPSKYETGQIIKGVESFTEENLFVFHAGTKTNNGKFITAGGRVLAVTALGKDLKTTVEQCYTGIKRIQFDGMHFRKDIGRKVLNHITGG